MYTAKELNPYQFLQEIQLSSSNVILDLKGPTKHHRAPKYSTKMGCKRKCTQI